MKKIMMVLMGVSFIFATNTFAADNPIQKLERGVVNIVTAPIEIPKEIRAHWIQGSEKTYHIVVWILCGFVKGSVMTTARIGPGAWDVVTFPVRIPKNYESVLKPDYVFDEWPQRKEGVIYKNLGDK